jgi:plasmid replication initiation protein
MYRLIELAQKEIEGIKLKDNLRKIAPTNFGREITMPVSDILKDEQDKHYTIAKAAFRSLSEKHIEYEDDEVWSYTPIITAPEIKKNSGSVKFYVFDNIWRCLLDFTKGFKKYELITAMKFKSAYAMRFYELMSGQTKPLFVPLEGPDGLRERFYLQGKYEKVNDFRRKVIDVAKKELDESSPYSFVAKEEKAGKKIIGWTFFPVFYENREDPALQEQARMAKVTARLQLENNIYDYLKFSFDFKSDEINKNKKTLIEGQNRIPDFMGFLGELKKGARLAENPKGYVIGAIKRKLKEI